VVELLGGVVGHIIVKVNITNEKAISRNFFTRSGHDEKVIAGCCMIKISLVQTPDHKVSVVAIAVHDLQGLFVQVVGGEVLGDAAVVCVAQLAPVLPAVEKIVHVYIVDIRGY
jgi:hypothetical protein